MTVSSSGGRSFTFTAEGGEPGDGENGGDGWSGGGTFNKGHGGENGSDGEAKGGNRAGSGQGPEVLASFMAAINDNALVTPAKKGTSECRRPSCGGNGILIGNIPPAERGVYQGQGFGAGGGAYGEGGDYSGAAVIVIT